MFGIAVAGDAGDAGDADDADAHDAPADAACLAGDPDEDADGICDQADNCPSIGNVDQDDADHDGVGTLCDPRPGLPDRIDRFYAFNSEAEVAPFVTTGTWTVVGGSYVQTDTAPATATVDGMFTNASALAVVKNMNATGTVRVFISLVRGTNDLDCQFLKNADPQSDISLFQRYAPNLVKVANGTHATPLLIYPITADQRGTPICIVQGKGDPAPAVMELGGVGPIMGSVLISTESTAADFSSLMIVVPD